MTKVELQKERARAKWAARKPEMTAQRKAWGDANKDHLKVYMREWRAKNKDRANELAKKTRDKNLHIRMANNAMRRAVAKQATPVWADMGLIADAYRFARCLTDSTGMKWEVDHIVPLRSKTVCGLHSHTNIRVITKNENLAKRHWTWPGMPE